MGVKAIGKGNSNEKSGWMNETDRDLSKYARYGHAIRNIDERLEELSKGRRTTAVYEIMEGSRGGENVIQEEAIVIKILELEERRNRYIRFRENIEAALDFAFDDREHKRFIELYWWSNYPKSKARDVIMDDLYLSRRSFYRWREEILTKLAILLGYLDEDELTEQKMAPNLEKDVV
ncbi:MAG: hypothetical protein ABFD66_15225 [Smithella sp.]